MNQTDLVILAVYLICVVYVIRRAWDSLEERAIVKHEGNEFDYPALKDFVDVKFKFDDFYPFAKQPTQLATTIENKTRTATITVDWERGSLQNFQGGDRRLIRLIKGMQEGDQTKVQAPSSISPKGKLSVALTAEELLSADPETKELRAAKPMVDLEKIAGDKDGKAAYGKFINMQEPLRFSLRLPLQITNIIEGSKKDMWGFVDCNFSVSRIPRIDQVPWNPKK